MDTGFSNILAEEVLKQRLVPGLHNYDTLAMERHVKEGLRVDFSLTGPDGKCFVEVKSATVVDKRVARFPDSVTPRSVRQLEWLTGRVASVDRAVLLHIIQREDVEAFTINWTHSSLYAEAFKEAFPVSPSAFSFRHNFAHGARVHHGTLRTQTELG